MLHLLTYFSNHCNLLTPIYLRKLLVFQIFQPFQINERLSKLRIGEVLASSLGYAFALIYFNFINKPIPTSTNIFKFFILLTVNFI